MAALLGDWVIWKGLGWLCFVGLTLLCLALLFPRPAPPRHELEKLQADFACSRLPGRAAGCARSAPLMRALNTHLITWRIS